MEQDKIGKFIMTLRKEKNMTQQELADKIGVTDRAISKWENGRGMPDLSLIRSLCDELGITINELLSGERIDKENYQIKFEENVLKTIDYSSRKINKTKKKILFSLGAIGLVFLSILIMFLIDVNRMNNNRQVLFSTWGFKYTPAVDLHEAKLEQAIKDYLLGILDSEEHYNNEKTFVSFKTYLIDEKNNELYYIYAWVLEESYYLEDDEVKSDSGSSIPYKFIVEKNEDAFIVTDSRIPRDGSYYEIDMKAIFPYSVRKDMENIYDDGTIEKLELDIQNQVNLYFHKR